MFIRQLCTCRAFPSRRLPPIYWKQEFVPIVGLPADSMPKRFGKDFAGDEETHPSDPTPTQRSPHRRKAHLHLRYTRTQLDASTPDIRATYYGGQCSMYTIITVRGRMVASQPMRTRSPTGRTALYIATGCAADLSIIHLSLQSIFY
ncbi:hypothetical protein FIBSPDRAFT_933071 [Athelia psychrophila]|uniref:Uncharacterized protein n=1 Tax=Athelia psychrophila TaxID=1759441 RepID=A0A166HM19_9AGAM|nr:hypothetical protein FIBSPDRAFT_933071 [Fibularhizoctonia sp. CBS 109695]